MPFNYFFVSITATFFNSEIKNISDKLSLTHKNQHDVYYAIKFLLVYYVHASIRFIMCYYIKKNLKFSVDSQFT